MGDGLWHCCTNIIEIWSDSTSNKLWWTISFIAILLKYFVNYNGLHIFFFVVFLCFLSCCLVSENVLFLSPEIWSSGRCGLSLSTCIDCFAAGIQTWANVETAWASDILLDDHHILSGSKWDNAFEASCFWCHWFHERSSHPAELVDDRP